MSAERGTETRAQPPTSSWRRRLLIIGAAAAALLVLAASLVIALFDVNRYKTEIEDAVSTHSGRRLHLNGDLGLSIYPTLTIDLPASSLSAADSEAEFLSFASARMKIALLPLLRQEIVIESMHLRQARATVTLRGEHEAPSLPPESAAPGASDIADTAETANTATAPAAGTAERRRAGGETNWEIGHLVLSDAAITVHDAASGKTLVLSAITLETGRLSRQGETITAAQLELHADGQHAADAWTLAASAEEIALDRQKLSSGAIVLSASRAGTQPFNAQLKLDSLSGPRSSLVAENFLLTATRRDGPASMHARVGGPLNANLEEQTLTLAQLDGELALTDPALPAGQAELPFSGAMTLDARRQHATLELASSASDASFKASIELANFARPEIAFALNADRLNLDSYLAPARPVTLEAARQEPAPAAQAASSKRGKNSAAAEHIVRISTAVPVAVPAEPAFDLTPLRELRLDGTLQIAQLQARGIKAASIHASVHSAAGRATLAPVSAQLYGGRADGDFSLDAQVPQLSLNLAFNDVDFGALARDALARNDLSGRGNVDLALSSSGRSRAELTRAAQGTLRFALRDVALVGIDLSAVLGQLKEILRDGGKQSGRFDRSQRTLLSHLDGTVKLADGVARNDDLDGAAPRLALGGYGQFDLLSKTLDYTLRVMMAANPAEGSKLLRALEGLPVPVQVSGPADELRYSVSLRDVASDALTRRGADIGAALVEEAERFLGKLFGGDERK